MVEEAVTGLDWRAHRVGPAKPCRLCGKPALCRDEDGDPCHKVCAEEALPVVGRAVEGTFERG